MYNATQFLGMERREVTNASLVYNPIPNPGSWLVSLGIIGVTARRRHIKAAMCLVYLTS